MCVQSMGQEYPLEEEMATHSTIIAWKIPWTEEPGGLQSMGSQSRTQVSTAHTRTHACAHARMHACLFRLQCVDSKEAVGYMALKVRDCLSLSYAQTTNISFSQLQRLEV